jgi:O-antigen/teichoic acid export membrane protein
VSTDRPDLAGHLQRRAASGSWWTLVNTVISLPVAFLANAVVARSLGVADFGRLAVLTVVLTWVAQLTDLGVGDATVRFGAMAHAQGDARSVDVLLGRALGYRLLVQLPLLTVAIIVVLTDQPLGIVAVAVLSVLVPMLFGGGTQALTIESRTDTAARLGLLANLLTQLGAVLAALFVTSAAAVWGARNLAGALVVPLALLVLARHRRRALLRPRDPRANSRAFWSFAVHTWATGLLAVVVLSRSEVVLLGWWVGAEAAGVFALATGVAAYLVGPVSSVVNPIVPAAAGLVAAAPERLVEAFDRTMRVTGAMAGLVVAAGTPALVPLIVPVFGEEYTPAVPFVPVAVAAATVAVLGIPAQVFLRSRGLAPAVLRLTAWAAGVDVVLAVVLIPTVGTWGAMAAFAATNLVLALTMVAAERRVQRASGWRVARDVAPWLGGCAVAALMLSLPVDGSPWVLALLGAVGGTLGFVLLARVARIGIAERDGEVLLAALPPWLRGIGRVGVRLLRTRERS